MTYQLLLADDSVTIQKAVEISFHCEDFDITAVSSGLEAINKVKEIKPDVVLLDTDMPGMDGYETCKTLKADAETSEIPVCLLAGKSISYDEAKANDSGANAHLLKPFETQALVDRIRALVGAPASVPVGTAVPTQASQPAAVPPLQQQAPAAIAQMPPPPVAQPAVTAQQAPPPAAPISMSMPISSPPPAPQASTSLPQQAPKPAPKAAPPPPVMPQVSMQAPQQAPPPVMPQVSMPAPQQAPPPVMPQVSMPAPQQAPPPVASASMSEQAPMPAPSPTPPVAPVPKQTPPVASASMLEQAPKPTPPMPAPSPTPSVAPVPKQAPPPTPPAASQALGAFDLSQASADVPKKAPLPTPPSIESEQPATPKAATAGDGEISRESVEALTRKIIEEIVWDVVPQLAETIIREQLDKLVKS